MEEKIIKKYLLEHGYITGDINRYPEMSENTYQEMMFKKYLEGDILINRLEFDIWLKHFDNNNLLFGRILKQMGYIHRTDELIEVACSLDHNVSKNILLASKKVILDGSTESFDSDRYFIMNGDYAKAISRAFIADRFSVGVCGDDNAYTTKQIAFYQHMKDILSKMGLSDITEVEETFDRNSRVYLLNYNLKPEFEKQITKRYYISQK